tara:strand:- start:234 stop:344 length:111 start_codon:yes stop_codon:yes gene_type:complete
MSHPVQDIRLVVAVVLALWVETHRDKLRVLVEHFYL